MPDLKFTHSVIDLSSLKKNDSLVVRLPEGSSLTEAEKVSRILNEMVPKGAFWCVVPCDVEFKTVSEDEMNKAGWYRK